MRVAATLTVNGANFETGAVLFFNSAPRPATVVSASQLTATVSWTHAAFSGIRARQRLMEQAAQEQPSKSKFFLGEKPSATGRAWCCCNHLIVKPRRFLLQGGTDSA